MWHVIHQHTVELMKFIRAAAAAAAVDDDVDAILNDSLLKREPIRVEYSASKVQVNYRSNSLASVNLGPVRHTIATKEHIYPSPADLTVTESQFLKCDHSIRPITLPTFHCLQSKLNFATPSTGNYIMVLSNNQIHYFL